MLNTPRAYFERAKRLPPGPRKQRAVMQTMLAMKAADAGRRGDMVTASRALEGLRGLSLAGLGDINPDAMAAIIRRTSAGDISPERARSIANTISTITSIAGTVVQIIALAVGGDVGKVLRFVDAVIRGNAPPDFLSNNDFVNFCRVWQGMSSGGFISIATSAVNAIASASRMPADSRNNINLFIRWTAAALDSICAEVPSVPPAGAAPASPPCVGAGVRPDNHGLPQVPASCCPTGSAAIGGANAGGALYLDQDGICKNTPPAAASPQLAARQRWRRAVGLRQGAEALMRNTTPALRAAGLAADARTSTELCAAERAVLSFVTPTPALNQPTSTTYVPPTTQPRCFLITPPEAGCSCPRVPSDWCSGAGCTTSDDTGTQSGGGIVTFALPAAALLWYLMK